MCFALPETSILHVLQPAASLDLWRRPVADMHRACAANDMGNRTTPSYVAFTDTERLIGDAAKNQVGGGARLSSRFFGAFCNLRAPELMFCTTCRWR